MREAIKNRTVEATCFGALLLFGSLLQTQRLKALPNAGQEQGTSDSTNLAVQPASQSGTPPPDAIVVRDGTPLTLRLENDLSSKTAKVGDTIEFTTAYHLRIAGLVIVPKGTAVSGTVKRIRHARHASQDVEIEVAIEKIVLPGGETACLRLFQSASKKSAGGAKELARHDDEWSKLGTYHAGAANLVIPFVMLASKGQESTYPAGIRITVYFDGPSSINRDDVVNRQPPAYQGPAKIFVFNGVDKQMNLFIDQKHVGRFDHALQLELNPGTYTFSTSKTNDRPVQLEVHENQKYWIEREKGGLIAKDSKEHEEKMEQLEGAPGAPDNNFALPPYHGPGQVFFRNQSTVSLVLFCGQNAVSTLNAGQLRLELAPGKYSFNTGLKRDKAVELEVEADHRYWIERRRGGYFLEDFEKHKYETLGLGITPVMNIKHDLLNTCEPLPPH